MIECDLAFNCWMLNNPSSIVWLLMAGVLCWTAYAHRQYRWCYVYTLEVDLQQNYRGCYVWYFLPRCMECRRGLAIRILSVRLSVRLSVYLSNAWIVTKRKKDLSRLLYIRKII